MADGMRVAAAVAIVSAVASYLALRRPATSAAATETVTVIPAAASSAAAASSTPAEPAAVPANGPAPVPACAD